MNIYERNLQDMITKMQDCQKSTQNKLSCIDCDKITECETRFNYTKAVFEDMTQGSLQDFDF